MVDKSNWSGSPTSLLFELDRIAKRERMVVRSNQWPKAANALMRKLNEVKITLAKSGIKISNMHLGEMGKIVTIEKTIN